MPKNIEKITTPAPLKKAIGEIGVVSFDEEASRIRVEFEAREEFLHAGGVIQGGFVSTWIDLSMAYAIHYKTDFKQTPLSLELKISFLNPAMPGKVFAEAWIVKMGRSIAFLEGHLLNESGEVIATGSSTVKLFTYT